MTPPNIAELIGAELDYWVAKAEGFTLVNGAHFGYACDPDEPPMIHPTDSDMDGRVIFSPSTNWAQGGPILEREGICVARFDDEAPDRRWWAELVSGSGYFASVDLRWPSPTPLIAAMRAYVSSKQPTGEPP